MDGFERMTILAVEPHSIVRRQLHGILEQLGIGTILAAETVSDGLRLIGERDIDALFVDWSNQTDALDMLIRLRGPGSPNPFLPAIVVTAHCDRDHVRQARNAGATEYLLKPIAQQSVAARLRAVTRHPRRFVDCADFFGPDRRRHTCRDLDGPDRRQNC